MKPIRTVRTVFAASLLVTGLLVPVGAHAQTVNTPVAPAPATAPTTAPAPAPAPAPELVTVTDVPVDGTLVRMGRSETVIRAPMDMVVRALTDFPRYNEFIPHVRESRVVRRNRSATDVYLQVPLGGSLGVIWALLRIDARRQPDRFTLNGQAVDSNMDRFETRSLIERLPGDVPRTRVVFEVLALPRLPFPSSVFTREMRDAARTVATNLRARVERQVALSAVAPPVAAPAVPPNATSSR